MTAAGRSFFAAVVSLLACVAILAALLAHYADNLAGSSASFANRAVSVVQSPGVQSLIVTTLTDRVAADTGESADAQAVLHEAVQQAVESQQVTDDVRTAAASLQSQLLSGTATRLTLALPDFGPSLASSIESRSPQLAEEVRNLGTVTVIDVPIPTADASAVHDLADAGRDDTLLLILSVALIALALLISSSRARTLRVLGVGIAVTGVATAAAYLIGHEIVLNEFSSAAARTAAGAVLSTYLRGLEIWGTVLIVIGIALAVIASTQARRRPARDYRY